MRTPEKRFRATTTVLPGGPRRAAALARERLRPRLWPIVQTAAAAVAAWYLAELLLDVRQPVFASIAAVISVGATLGERRQRAAELIGGVVVGIACADLLVHLIGTGPPQIGLMITLAMGAAVLLGGGPLVVTEAGVSALLLAALEPAGPALPPGRFLEALIGGGVALLVSAVLFPPNPTLIVSRAARSLLEELARTLMEVAGGLAEGDAGRAGRALQAARAVDDRLDKLEEALETGRESARLTPYQRSARAELARSAQTLTQLDFAVRNTRVLARHALRYVRRTGGAPEGLPEAIHELGLAAEVWARAAAGEPPERADEVGELARASARRATEAAERRADVAVAAIAAQVRSIAADLVRASEPAAAASWGSGEAPTEELLVQPPAAAEQPSPRGGAGRSRGRVRRKLDTWSRRVSNRR